MAPGIAGLILAGGSGERYGSPKAFARLPDGRPFLAVCAEALKAGGAEPVLATLPAGTPALQAPGLECLPLPAPGLAMFDSLRLGLQHLLADTGWRAVIVLPVDHPLVAPATVRALAASPSPAAIPSHGGKHGHPVLLSRPLAEGIASGAHPGPTLREVLRTVATADVPVEDPGINANCNTPEALAAALARRER
jgi:CTP:molybdopterin cytidylyltransferase MocA